MKNLCFVLSMAATLVAPAAHAAMQVTLTQNTSQYSSGSGGEFRANTGGSPINLASVVNQSAYSAATSGTLNGQYYFQTFCIEYGEHFSPGTTYNVAISPNALNGGQGAAGDPISAGTAWLYSQFAKGKLNGWNAAHTIPTEYNYTYGSGRSSTAGQLQDVIWWLENETVPSGNVPTTANIFYNAVLYQFGGSAAAAMADAGNNSYGVRALNLGAAGAVQDQLVIVPEPTTIIAGALLLLPFGVSTLRSLRRRQTA